MKPHYETFNQMVMTFLFRVPPMPPQDYEFEKWLTCLAIDFTGEK
jgi:hypothetical protein